jgi:hypothetical protein
MLKLRLEPIKTHFDNNDRQAAIHMSQLATKLDVTLVCDVGGTDMIAKPHQTPKEIFDVYVQDLKLNSYPSDT